MPDILHRVGIKSSLDKVYIALSTREGLAAWWTENTQGESKIDGVEMMVLELNPAKLVLWQVADGPKDWIGTRISFDLKQEGAYCIVLFKHQGWREPNEHMHHCSTKWATFLWSLKALVETGRGSPSPHDLKIDNWN
jgi:hypothetical protein